jgi:hypothetical protein
MRYSLEIAFWLEFHIWSNTLPFVQRTVIAEGDVLVILLSRCAVDEHCVRAAERDNPTRKACRERAEDPRAEWV